MEKAKVIVRFLDGRLEKGYTHDFNPKKPSFYLEVLGDSTKKISVKMDQLKAVFFVRSFEGNRERNEEKSFAKTGSQSGRKVEVTFKDNEVMLGSTLSYSRDRIGFFLFPSDPESNNERVFVVSSAMLSFRYL
jgi:hypothetical protein